VIFVAVVVQQVLRDFQLAVNFKTKKNNLCSNIHLNAPLDKTL